MNLCEVVTCSSAKELLSHLSPRSEFFDESHPKDWIFRGHANAAWKLVPAAFRDAIRLFVGPSITLPWQEWRNRDQIQAEAATLLQFINEADSAGLPIPHDLTSLREEFDKPFQESWYKDVIEQGSAEWPPSMSWPVVALAQHYGLATRFLDWTRSAFAAAYFAAIDSFNQPNDATSIAVWAFSTASDAARRGLSSNSDNSIAVITAPYATNPNLRAQEGVHIVRYVRRAAWMAEADREDFSSYFGRVATFGQTFGRPALIRFEMERSQAPGLLWYLRKEGVSAAKLFPGYAGAARSVLEARRSRK